VTFGNVTYKLNLKHCIYNDSIYISNLAGRSIDKLFRGIEYFTCLKHFQFCFVDVYESRRISSGNASENRSCISTDVFPGRMKLFQLIHEMNMILLKSFYSCDFSIHLEMSMMQYPPTTEGFMLSAAIKSGCRCGIRS
jgi:hypothetical protein